MTMLPPNQNTRYRIPVVTGLCRGNTVYLDNYNNLVFVNTCKNHTKQTLKYERISYKIQECDIQQYCIYKFRPQYHNLFNLYVK